MIKLVAIDLDGTLLKDDKTISDRNKEVLQQAKAEGVKIVLCTGRPLVAIESYLDRLELRDAGDYSITFNGSAVQKNDTGEELVSHSFGLQDVQRVASVMAQLNLPLDVISVDTCIHLTTAPEHPSIYQSINPVLKYETKKVSDLTDDIIFNKMVVAIEPAYLDEQLKQLPQELHESFNIMKSRDCLLEIIHPEGSKANGIALLGEQLGITADEVMALGDEENDVSMIEYAGMGVVMENGNPSLKEIAQYVTKSNEEDGVAHAVEKFVLNKEG